MTDCNKFKIMISSLTDCELSPEQEAELRAHLESCSDCRRVYNAFKGISDAMSDELVSPPESLSKGVMYKIKTQDNGKKPPFFAFGRFTAIAACLALILFGASKFGWFDNSSSTDSCTSPVFEDAEPADPYSDRTEDVQESKAESASDSNYLEYKDEGDKSDEGINSDEGGNLYEGGNSDEDNSDDDIKFSTPMSGGSTSNAAYTIIPAELTTILSELFDSDEIEVFEGSHNTEDETLLLIISDDDKKAELLDMLCYSGIDIIDPDLTDTPNYTLLFPDSTTLSVWSVDDSICCMLGDNEMVYLASGTMEELENYFEPLQDSE